MGIKQVSRIDAFAYNCEYLSEYVLMRANIPKENLFNQFRRGFLLRYFATFVYPGGILGTPYLILLAHRESRPAQISMLCYLEKVFCPQLPC
jgi:hypothetical protein